MMINLDFFGHHIFRQTQITKASLLAGVGLALAMYCRETGRSSRDFHAELVLGPPVWE